MSKKPPLLPLLTLSWCIKQRHHLFVCMFPVKAVEEFRCWSVAVGFNPSVNTLLYVQLGMVRTLGLRFLHWSAKAHSRV